LLAHIQSFLEENQRCKNMAKRMRLVVAFDAKHVAIGAIHVAFGALPILFCAEIGYFYACDVRETGGVTPKRKCRHPNR
jgi:hypothetical protein